MTAPKTADKAQVPATTPDPKKDRVRSPSYPAFPLTDAIERARTFYAHENFNWAYASVATRHWNLSPTSSTGMRALAALIHFGLLEERGTGEARQVRLSDIARTILHAPEERSAERLAAIQQAALTPRVYQSLWARYGPNLPTSGNLEFDLSRSGEYSADSVRPLIADFRATVDFAQLTQAAKLDPQNGERKDNPPPKTDLKPPKPETQEPEMPGIARAQSVPFDLTIPLISGGQAVLRVPRPMTEEDYTLLTELLAANLKAIKKALVSAPTKTVEVAGVKFEA